MAHLYKMIEWQAASGYWYVNDVTELDSDASKWYTPVRILGITPVEYVELLKNHFNIASCHYKAESNVLSFSFKTQADARKFKNWMNAEARKKNYICGKP